MLLEVQTKTLLIQVMGSVLQFIQVRSEDAAVYVCIASNILGEDRQELLLVTTIPLSVYIYPQYQVNKINFIF